MENQPQSFWWKFWGRPVRFFAWLTFLSLLGWVVLGLIIKHNRLNPDWRDFRLVSGFVTCCLVFAAALKGTILSAIPATRPSMSWTLRRGGGGRAARGAGGARGGAGGGGRGRRARD